jgi:hypothetical protein
MTDEDRPNDEPQRTSFLMRSTTAAAVTALCTVLVALSAFLAASAASDSDDNYAIAAQSLEDANFWYEQGRVCSERISATSSRSTPTPTA